MIIITMDGGVFSRFRQYAHDRFDYMVIQCDRGRTTPSLTTSTRGLSNCAVFTPVFRVVYL